MLLRVGIVEDDLRWRNNLERLIAQTKDLEFIGSFASGEEAVAALPRCNPQVVLMDINLPKMSGIECLRNLRATLSPLQVVMLTVYDDCDRVFQALQMGASGYLIKSATAEEIVEAILDVHRGGAPMSPYIARRVVQSFQRPAPELKSAEALSKRETEVLQYIALGYREKEVAATLGLTTATVHSYVKSIYSKLQVHTRTEAIRKLTQ